MVAPTPLRILLVTARYLPHMGGTEIHTREVAKRMALAGHRVTVLTTMPARQRLLEEEHSNGFTVLRVPAWPSERDFYFAPGVYRVIQSGDWDIVHCQGYHTLVPPIAMLASWRANIPYVLTFHSGGHSARWRMKIRWLQRLLLHPLLTRASRLIGVSNWETAFFRKQLRLTADKVVYVPNGSNLPAPSGDSPPSTDERIIVSIGRLERYKGHHHLIEALPHVLARSPNARLQILGAGRDKVRLEKLARRRGVDHRVTISTTGPDQRSLLADVLSTASLVALMSEYESSGMAALEAIAMRRRVLLAETTGLQELWTHPLVSMVSLRSSPIQLAECILYQLSFKDTTSVPPSLPTWDDCVARLLEIYRKVVAKGC